MVLLGLMLMKVLLINNKKIFDTNKISSQCLDKTNVTQNMITSIIDNEVENLKEAGFGGFKMKRILLICLFLSFGLFSFGQEIIVTSVVFDGDLSGIYDGKGSWPSSNPVKSRWDALFEKYKLVQFQNDPFNPNELLDKITKTGWDAVKKNRGRGIINGFMGVTAYSVYLTMNNKKYICLYYNEAFKYDSYYYWAYEVR